MQLNAYSIILGASSLVLVFTYPLMKRVTHWVSHQMLSSSSPHVCVSKQTNKATHKSLCRTSQWPSPTNVSHTLKATLPGKIIIFSDGQIPRQIHQILQTTQLASVIQYQPTTCPFHCIDWPVPGNQHDLHCRCSRKPSWASHSTGVPCLATQQWQAHAIGRPCSRCTPAASAGPSFTTQFMRTRTSMMTSWQA